MLSLTRGNSKTLPRGDCRGGRMSPSHLGDFFWFRFARRSGMFFGAGLAFALAALTLAGLRIDLFGGIRPAPFTSFQGFCRPCREDWALLGQTPHQMLSL